MPFIRSIGRWTMTALVINSIIGSGIFGVPSELTRLLGRTSPIAMAVAALVMAVIMLCVAEVASQFSEPGGPYLYVRTDFGIIAGMQLGWFHLLSTIGGDRCALNRLGFRIEFSSLSSPAAFLKSIDVLSSPCTPIE